MTTTHAPIGELLPDFKKCLLSELNSSDSKLCFFSETYAVYSLTFTISLVETTEDGDRIFELTKIGWQEEGDSYHNVCNTGWNRFDEKKEGEEKESIIALYNLDQDLLLEDAYLFDKYDDCSDGWFSDRLSTVFQNYPDLIESKKHP